MSTEAGGWAGGIRRERERCDVSCLAVSWCIHALKKEIKKFDIIMPQAIMFAADVKRHGLEQSLLI